MESGGSALVDALLNCAVEDPARKCLPLLGGVRTLVSPTLGHPLVNW